MNDKSVKIAGKTYIILTETYLTVREHLRLTLCLYHFEPKINQQF